MRDLACFKLLLERRWEDPTLPALLEELAARTSRQRVAFFGALLDLLSDGSPAARALHARALACLRDGDGHVLVEHVVDALEDPGARESAVAALRSVAARQRSRWLHALFHPDEAVRRLAVAEPAPGDAGGLEIFALADPSLRETLLARGTTCGPEGTGAVLDFYQSKVIDAALARRLLDPAKTIEWVAKSRRRDERHLGRV
ncbi:MAG TPA: hypothetical protein VGH28_34395, partial [Polyangiaceae bacterium]